MPVLLASASPRRRELLEELGLSFSIIEPDVEEHTGEHLTGREMALLNAHRKARHVAKQHPDCLVLGADTVVSLGSRLFGKPRNIADAENMLRELAGRTHQVITAVCLLELRHHQERLFAETTGVTFRPLDAPLIREYLAKINPLDKAGGYAIQEHGSDLVRNVEGSFSNVVGLPLERLREELANWPASSP